MKKTVQAVKYALDTLHISPDSLFKLIETSQGYEGEDYNRWLAEKIIRTADSEGIPFTELLVKKLKILAEIMSNSEEGISQLVDDFISERLEGVETVYDFSGLGYSGTTDSQEDFDWFNGINPMGEEILVNNTDNSAYVGFLDSKGAGKSEVTLAGRSMGYSMNSKGGAMLLRFILMDEALEPTNNTYVFISDAAFFKENSSITQAFMNQFDLVEAIYLNKLDTMPSSFASGLDLITVWKTYSAERDSVSSISACDLLKGGSPKLFYADSEELEVDYLKFNEATEEVPELDFDLNLSEDTYDVSKSDYHAYLSVNGTQRVADYPIIGSELVYGITKENLRSIIVYFAGSKSLEGSWGYGRGLKRVCDGLEGYNSLVANCLPIFLYSPDSLFCTIEGTSSFNYSSDLVAELFEEYSPFMSFESKVLWDLAQDYSKAMVKGQEEELENQSFYQIRKALMDDRFEKVYQEKYESAKSYVKQQLEGYLC